MALSLNKEDHDVYTYITSLDPYDRSNQIKKILRYYLTKDRAKPVLLKPPSKPERVNTKNEEVIFKNKNKSVVKPVISKSNNLSKGIKAQLLKESKDMDYGSYS